jgi:hypothetical protein
LFYSGKNFGLLLEKNSMGFFCGFSTIADLHLTGQTMQPFDSLIVVVADG